MGDYGELFGKMFLTLAVVCFLAGAAVLAAGQFIYRHVHVSITLSRSAAPSSAEPQAGRKDR